MNGRKSGLMSSGRRTWTRLTGTLLVAAVTAITAACSSSGSSTTSSTGGNTGGTGNAGAAANAKCGTTVPVGPSNPTGIYAHLPASLKSIYSSFPGELIKSPWATTKITAKPPWKIGYIAFAITNQYNQDVL